MAILNVALLTALLPSVLAFPGIHGRGMGHGPYVPSGKHLHPSGYQTGFPHPSGVPGGPGPVYHHSPAPIGTAPFPAQNVTAAGPTGTGVVGGGPVTLISTLNIIPVPLTTDIYGHGQSPQSTGAAGVGAPGVIGSPSQQSGAPGSQQSGAPGSQQPGTPGSQQPGAPGSQQPGSPGSQQPGSPEYQQPGAPGNSPELGPSGANSQGVPSGEAGATCGPAMVTVTQALTVTVTVPASPSNGAPGSGPGTPGQAPGQSPGSGPGQSPGSGPGQSPGAPGNGPGNSPTFTAPFPIGNSSASAGATGSHIVGTAVPMYHSPLPLPAHSQPAPVVHQHSQAVVNSPAPASTPAEAATSATSTPASVAVNADYHVAHVQHHQTTTSAQVQQYQPLVPQQSSTRNAQVQEYQPPTPQQSPSPSPAPANAPANAPVTAPSSSSAPAKQPVNSSGGVKARGLLYGSLSAAQSFDTSNIGWGWDWDSSPSPASGHATGSLSGLQFVPMLLSTADVHTSLWEGNSAGAEWVMGFNEPDQCGGGGSCMSVSDVVSGWGTYFSSLSASKCSPATTNDLTTQGKGLSYMTQFLEACTGCKFDALAFHYYGSGSDIAALTSTIQAYQKLQKQYNIPELWIPEMAPTDQPSAAEVTAMLAVLDNPANGVTRYAFNGLSTGTGVQLAGEVASAYCS